MTTTATSLRTPSPTLTVAPSSRRVVRSQCEVLADEVAELLGALPERLEARSEPFPLLAAVRRSEGVAIARRMMMIAAQVHPDADERWTAEYLLRHRHDPLATRGTTLLISRARFAADREVRRRCARVTPIGRYPLEEAYRDAVPGRVQDPSVGEVVLAYFERVTGHRPASELARSRLLDAVAVAVELGEELAASRLTKSSLLAMRTDARPRSRLSVRLRAEFDDDVAARSLARLLIGASGTPITTALLWWAAQPHLDPATIPSPSLTRWTRDLADADPDIRARCRLGYRRRMKRIVECAVHSQSGSFGRVAESRQIPRLASGTVQSVSGTPVS